MTNNNAFSLEGKIFLVTGASSGIGFEICRVIDSLGGRLIAVARREENLIDLLSKCKGKEHKYVAADLVKESDLDRIIEAIDKVDGIVHCAGLLKNQLIKFLKMDLFMEMQAVNVNSIVYLMNTIYTKKKITKNASVVLISSLGAMTGIPGGTFYCATKAELFALAKVWAYELETMAIRTNCISPAIVETELITRVYESITQEDIDTDKSKYPLGYGKPDDVAYPVAFLLSDASRGINGQNIVLDGGRMCNPMK